MVFYGDVEQRQFMGDMRDNIGMANQSPQTKFEIFSPPYLNWGAHRPVITTASASLAYNATFHVETPDGAIVKDAILVRNSAQTHSSDPSQRAVILPIIGTDGSGLTFRAPPDAELATPGPWMLFLRTDVPAHGVLPSEAAMVTLG